jgi:hypothetical protein
VIIPQLLMFFLSKYLFCLFFYLEKRKRVDGKQEKREKIIACQDFNGKKNNNLGVKEILSTKKV